MAESEINEARFIELMNEIPIMAAKLDRILDVMTKIEEHGVMGLNRKFDDDDTVFKFDPRQLAEDQALQAEVLRKREESRKLQREADDLERELNI